ncbi:MAG TPA: hypothetical protein PKD91_02065, partial [Bacteroidia bacterium]|nr:hypothetical protein [Bacteroidia bacterium]
MKKSFVIVYLQISLFVLTATISNAQVMWQVSNDGVIKWHYLDGDEFKNPILDSAKWQTTYPWGRSLYCNKEQQYYTHQGNH